MERAPRLKFIYLTRLAMVGLLVGTFSLHGRCAFLSGRPETAPELYASPSSNLPWSPRKDDIRSIPSDDLKKGALIPKGFDLNSGAKRINELINLALNSNPGLKAQWQKTRAEAAIYGMSYSRYYPRITYMSQGGYSRFMYSSIVPPGDDRLGSLNAQVGIEYSISEFGRRKAEVAASHAALNAVNLDFNRKLQDVVFGVKQAFYALAAAQEMVTAANVNLQFADTDLESVSDRMNRGLATLPDFRFAQERKARAELDLDDAQARQAEAQADLALAIGVPADADLKVEALDKQEVPRSLGRATASFIAEALRSRPDLTAEASRLKNREALSARAEAEFRPTLSFGGYYNETQWWLNLHHPTPLPSMGSTPVQTPYYAEAQPFYSAMFTLKWDLFNGFRRHNDVRRSAAEKNVQKNILRLHELGVIADVWRAYFVFTAMRQKYEDARKLWDAASESYDAYNKSYREGLSNIVELLAAQRDLAHARYAKILATADFLTASAAVDYSIGVSSGAFVDPAR